MRTFKDVTFDSRPTMLAAWPGMGNVGIIAIDYIRTHLEATTFAEIDMTPFFIPDAIIVKDGIAQLPEIPGAVFHYVKNPDLIIFESSTQIGGKAGIVIIKAILDIAAQFDVKAIYTAAAFAQPMPHTQEPEVMAASNNVEFFRMMTDHNIEPMPDGQIAGQNGLLLGVAATRDIDACCILGTIPSFATNLSYPKASLSVLRKLEDVIGISVDHADLVESVEMVDRQLAAIEDRIREYFPQAMENAEEEEEIHEIEHDQVPRYIMDKIERLFSEVADDRTKAKELKEELDRWNLFELYEHRFLKIFKTKKDETGEDA